MGAQQYCLVMLLGSDLLKHMDLAEQNFSDSSELFAV